MQSLNAFHGHPAYLEVFIGTYVLCVVPEIVLSVILRSGKTAQKSDKGSKAIVILAANLAVGLGFSMAIAFPGFAIQSAWKPVFDAGIAIWLIGSLFRFYSMRTLGWLFTYDVAISAGQHVVDRGPYRWLRHPSYTGALLAFLGLEGFHKLVGFLFGNFLRRAVIFLDLSDKDVAATFNDVEIVISQLAPFLFDLPRLPTSPALHP